MQPVITRSSVLFPVTCSSLFVMTRSTCNFCLFVDNTNCCVPSRLNKLLGHVVISQGGVVPFINPELLPSKSAKGKKEGASQEV